MAPLPGCRGTDDVRRSIDRDRVIRGQKGYDCATSAALPSRQDGMRLATALLASTELPAPLMDDSIRLSINPDNRN